MGFFYQSIFLGNYGSIMCMLIMIALVIMDKHEFVAGLLMAVAMSKPQLTMLFFVPILLSGKWKLILTTGFTMVVASLVTWSISHTSPIVLTKELMVAVNDVLPAGIFTIPGAQLGFSPSSIRLVSTAIGVCLYAFCIWYLGLANIKSDFLLHVSVMAILAGLWTYSNGPDRVILLLPTVYLFSKKGMHPYIVCVLILLALMWEANAFMRHLFLEYGENALTLPVYRWTGRFISFAREYLALFFYVLFVWQVKKSKGKKILPNAYLERMDVRI